MPTLILGMNILSFFLAIISLLGLVISLLTFVNTVSGQGIDESASVYTMSREISNTFSSLYSSFTHEQRRRVQAYIFSLEHDSEKRIILSDAIPSLVMRHNAFRISPGLWWRSWRIYRLSREMKKFNVCLRMLFDQQRRVATAWAQNDIGRHRASMRSSIENLVSALPNLPPNQDLEAYLHSGANGSHN